MAAGDNDRGYISDSLVLYCGTYQSFRQYAISELRMGSSPNYNQTTIQQSGVLPNVYSKRYLT